MKRFQRFLITNPADVGCDETRRQLHVYAEAVLAGTASHPGIAAHLEDCSPCADELEGLLAAVTAPCDD
jgi:hypothetical protein